MRRKRILILGCILLAVSGSIYLLTHLSALAYVRRIEHTTVAQFNRGEFYHTGMTRRNDGEVTLLALGIAGDWSRGVITGLPPIYGHAMVEHNGYVYVLGGVLDSALAMTRSVYVSRINTETYWLDPFTTTTPLLASLYPDGVFKHTAVVAGDYVYVIGGADAGDIPTTAVMFARLNPDGTLGAWEAAWAQLPAPRASVPAVEVNGYIYIVGGQPGSGTSGSNTILYTRPDTETGQIDQWFTSQVTLPYPVMGHLVEAYAGRIYVLGGFDTALWTTRLDVHYMTPTVTGELDAAGWKATKIMQNNMIGGAGLAFHGELFVVGGFPNFPSSIMPTDKASAALLDIQSGEIMTDDIVPDGWIQAQALLTPRAWHGVVLGGQYIYVLGGTDENLTPLPAQDMLNRASTTGERSGTGYARSGWYFGPAIELGRERKLLNFNWTVELPDPSTSLDLQYRTQTIDGTWSPWTIPLSPQSTQVGNKITYTVPFADASAFRFGYQVFLTTTNPMSYAPVLHRFEVVYDEAQDPYFAKSAEPPSGHRVLAYQRITYTLPFSNPNSYALNNVVIADTLPDFLLYEPGSITAIGGVTWTIVPDDSGVPYLRWTISSLPAGAGGQVGYVGVVSGTAPQETLLENQARLTSNNTNPKSVSTLHIVSDRPQSPGLAKTAEPPPPGPVLPGQVITYTLAYSNPPNNMLLNVVVSDALPAGLSLVSCNPACQQPGGGELRWSIAEMPSPDEGQVSFVARVDPNILSGTLITNTGYLGACVVGYPAVCTPVQPSQEVVHQVAAPLSPQIDKRASPPSGTTVAPGAHIHYTLIYTNNSSLILSQVVISDALPLSTTLVSGCDLPICQQVGDVLRWQFDDVAPGQSRQLDLVVSVDSTAAQGQVISNAAYAVGCGPATCAAPAASPLITHHVGTAFAAQIDKRASPPGGTAVTTGERITYTLVYTNLNDAALEGVVVTDALPAALSLVDGSCDPSCSVGGRVVTWTVGTLSAGQGGQASFAALVSSQASGDAPISNLAHLQASTGRVSSSAVIHTVISPYDLLVTKSDGVTKAAEGDTLIYTIHYTNIAPSGLVTLTNVVITEELLLNPASPDDWALLMASPGWEPLGFVPNRAIHHAGSLGPGQSGSITIAARLSSTLPSVSVIGMRNRVTVGDDGLHGRELNAANNVFVDADAVRGPDLALRNVEVPATVSSNTSIKINAELANLGTSPASSWEGAAGSWIAVELYAKPAGFVPAGPPLNPHDHAGGWRCATGAAQCGPEELLNLVFVGGDAAGVILEADGTRMVSIPAVFTQTGVYSLYTQVDIGFDWIPDPDYGRVPEANEDNNVAFLGTITVETGSNGGRIYLPLVLKKAP